MAPDDDWSIVTGTEVPSDDRTRLWRWRVKLLLGVFLTLLFVFLAVLLFLEFTESARVIRSKRSVRMNSKSRTAQNDIQIVSQSRRRTEHPNHRYLGVEPEGNIYKKIMKDLYDESGWSPKPFDVKAEQYLDSVRSIMGKKTKDSGSPMRFKGVFNYVVPSERFQYSKEINDLMQSHSGSKGALGVRSPGAPFRLPVKGREKVNINRQSLSKPNQFQDKPLTILLDIYPMTEVEDDFGKGKLKSKPPQKGGWRKFPNERRKGIIMKLNLYAKRGKLSRRQNLSGEDEGKVAEDKSFGWFSSKEGEKKEPEECSLMALKPQGKRVTAKWKNEDGEWIHAKRLSRTWTC